ncbi:HAMP domain-containing sensor histidine kinase [Hamadaea sp. NPDC050747]|uniref:sensor histidine kinase n=1 Tax=Hamadaea sp. NPDC050747 TaxID=3155789 RepID=UPI0033FCDAC3
MSADRPRLRTRLAVFYALTAVGLGAGPLAVVGLGAWSGGSTEEYGSPPGPPDNTLTVLLAALLGLLVVALAAAPIGWLLAGRAVRPLQELTTAAGGAAPDRLPGHGELGKYQEYADLSATLTGLYARLDSAYAAQRRFVADASHELRTPLTVQRALIQVKLADPEADATSLRAVCEEVLRLGDQQERLVGALLALAQGEQRPVAAEPVDLARLAADAVAARRASAESRGLTVRTDIRPALVSRADPTQLSSLIGNLLDNAVSYNVDSGRIDVATRCVAGRTVLTVGNTGPIVPPEAVGRILQPFQRLGPSLQADGPQTDRPQTDQPSAAQPQTGNSGLGLAIVRAIAGSHDADLHVRANVDGGLTVTVAFPET